MVCAKYGWTLHYVLWEISYLNLQMMLADAIAVDYEAENSQKNRKIINADDPSNTEAILGNFAQHK